MSHQETPSVQNQDSADDTEQVYFEGSPKLRADLGRVCRWSFAGLVLIAAPILYRSLFSYVWPPVWITLPSIFIGLLLPVIPVQLIHGIRYRITNYRIDYERAFLSRSIDTLELWHIEDVAFHQSLLDRIFNIGTITIVSHDETTPQLVLRGLPSPRPLFEMLKQRIIAVKRQRGVIKVDPG